MGPLLADDFSDPRPRGRVLGPARDPAPARDGRDVERVMSIDDGALRIQPPLQEGWGRTCLRYGPFSAAPGLALGVFILNGHNTSQSEVMEDSLRTRLARWARGSGASPTGRRLRKWLFSGRVGRVLRQARWWRRIQTGASGVSLMDENLALGFYDDGLDDPFVGGTGFVMHATGAENGELWAVADGAGLPLVRGVQNIPILYVVVLRADSAVLYASSLPGAHGLGSYPRMRPLAVRPRPDRPETYAVLQQSLLGQIGFRADTRVHGVRVTVLDGYQERWAGAAAAAARSGATLPPSTEAAVGGRWIETAPGVMILRPDRPIGLIVCDLDTTVDASFALVWRCTDGGDRWELTVGAGEAALASVTASRRHEVARSRWEVSPRIQIQDDGRELAVIADGGLLFGRRFEADEPSAGTGLGLVTDDGGAPQSVLGLEAHPRQVAIPAELDMGPPWSVAGREVVAADDFQGAAGDLVGRATPVGERTWQRLFGDGCLELTGGGEARWRADTDKPLPGRTIYALDWDRPDLVDLSVTLTPPGSDRGQGEHGTAGFCLWQDEDHFLLVNTWLDDCYGGASLSSFFNIGGFEDIYDAIWTNVGARVYWGRALRLRLVSDGMRYTVSIDDEPVLHRALSDVYPGCRPLRIAKVGLLGNWEWGADTGSRFAAFEARG